MPSFAVLLACVSMFLWLGTGGNRLYAQRLPSKATVSGVITDAESGELLSGATIVITGSLEGTTSDNHGRYWLLVTPGSRVNLRYSFVGYLTATRTVQVDKNAVVDIELQPTAVGLHEIEVVDSSIRDDVRSTQMGTISLDAAELEKLPAFLGEVDVIKSIQLLPGVQSGTEGSTGLYVRGGSPDQNLILMDGVPIYNANHVMGFLSVFNSDALEDVQLIKGGFPARYGGRLSSVVNLNMKQGDFQNHAADGVVGLVFSSFTSHGPLVRDRLSYLISARRTYIDVLARPFVKRNLSDGQSFRSYFYDTSSKLSLVVSPRDRLTLNVYLGRDVYGSTYETIDREAEPVFRTENTGGTQWGNRVASLRWTRAPTERLLINTTLLYSRYDFNVVTKLRQIEEYTPPVMQSESIRYASGIRDHGIRMDFDYRPVRAHRIRFGGSTTHHTFNPGVSSLRLDLTDHGVIDTTLTPNTFGFSAVEGYLYAEDDFEISRSLKANIGIHTSILSVGHRRYGSFEPRVAARYLLTPSWSLKLSFGTMQQYLHLLTNTGINLPTDIWLAATPRIGPQKSWQAAAGTSIDIANHFLVSVETYYKSMDGLLEYKAGSNYLAPNTDWQDKVDIGRGWSYGGEIFIRKNSGPTTGWIGYTLAWTRRRFGTLNEGRRFPYRYDRRHDVSAVGKRSLGDRFSMGATWVYGTGQAITLATGTYYDGRLLDQRFFTGALDVPELFTYGDRGGYRMAPYHRLDFVFNWHLDSAFFIDRASSILSVGAYNVYNRKNPFYIFSTSESNGRRQYKQASLFPILPFISYRFSF